MIDTVDDFITKLFLRDQEATEEESIKLLWASVDHLKRFGVTWDMKRNATSGDAEIVLNVEKIPALQQRTVYYEKSAGE